MKVVIHSLIVFLATGLLIACTSARGLQSDTRSTYEKTSSDSLFCNAIAHKDSLEIDRFVRSLFIGLEPEEGVGHEGYANHFLRIKDSLESFSCVEQVYLSTLVTKAVPPGNGMTVLFEEIKENKQLYIGFFLSYEKMEKVGWWFYENDSSMLRFIHEHDEKFEAWYRK